MTSPKLTAKIRNTAFRSMPNLHYGEMKEISRLKPSQIAAKFGLTQYTTKHGKRFWYKDNGSQVLGVAHTDSVPNAGTFQPVHFQTDTRIYFPTVDDRLGVYILLAYLTKAKVKIDILLTEDEELRSSTALWFDPPKKYNWMFMFDRMGKGAVTYQYDNENLRYRLGKFNIFPISRGNYSCIRELEHLGCVGINFGAGYHENHSEFAYVSVNELKSQLNKFLDFYREYQYVSMPHEVGYRRFVDAVNYHSYEFNRDARDNYAVQPYRNQKEQFGNGEIVDIGNEYEESDFKFDSSVSIDHGSEGKIFDYEDFGQWKKDHPNESPKRQVKTLVEVDVNGKVVGWIKDREIFKLYWDIDILPLDMTMINILRNTFKCLKIYDLVQLSPFWLVSSGYLTAIDADKIVNELDIIGFQMRMNLQGLMTPKQWEKQVAVGYTNRAKYLRSSSAHKKPIPVEERLERVASEKHKQRFTKPRHVKDKHTYGNADIIETPVEKKNPKRHIVLYPKVSADYTSMLKGTRALIKKGYTIEAFYTCEECKTLHKFDPEKQDRLPKLCAKCAATEKVESSISTSTEEIKDEPLKPLVDNQEDAGAGEILTKIQLKKEHTDDTRYVFIGKGNSKGVDKYKWLSPGKPLEKGKVGFVIEHS